ncbi:unnamed protein product, partial [Urochloa humidicola]
TVPRAAAPLSCAGRPRSRAPRAGRPPRSPSSLAELRLAGRRAHPLSPRLSRTIAPDYPPRRRARGAPAGARPHLAPRRRPPSLLSLARAGQYMGPLNKDPALEYMLLQAVRFAFRMHQFAGGFDPETMDTFEELRNLVHVRNSAQ